MSSGVPADWVRCTLGEVAVPERGSITDGPFGSNLTSAHYTDAGARVIRLENVGDGKFRDHRSYISNEHFDRLRKHEVLPGDLVVASLGDNLPRACLLPHLEAPALVKADCIRVRLGERVLPKFVVYALQAPGAKRWASERLKGVGRQRLGLAGIRALPLPLPPLDEQQRIVAVLEDHLTRLEAAQAYLSASERRLRLLKRSMLQREFHSVRAVGAPLVKLGDIADTALGKMLDAARSSGEPTPYLRNSNIRWGRIDLADVATVPLNVEERQRFALTSGDLLVCEGGEPGRCAVWRGSGELMTYQKALHRVRVHALVEVEYVAAALQEFVQSPRAGRVLTGTTIKHLPQERLRRIELPLPARSEQERIVALLKELDAAAGRAAADLHRAKDQHVALTRSLLTAAFSGRL